MFFDFDKFTNITASVFPKGGYSLQEALSVFHYYFQKYEEYTGHSHPPIRVSQIVHIVQEMPWICRESKKDSYFCVPAALYPFMIDKHFSTKCRRCDYNINHFFSGRIRELRYYDSDR